MCNKELTRPNFTWTLNNDSLFCVRKIKGGKIFFTKFIQKIFLNFCLLSSVKFLLSGLDNFFWKSLLLFTVCFWVKTRMDKIQMTFVRKAVTSFVQTSYGLFEVFFLPWGIAYFTDKNSIIRWRNVFYVQIMFIYFIFPILTKNIN